MKLLSISFIFLMTIYILIFFIVTLLCKLLGVNDGE